MSTTNKTKLARNEAGMTEDVTSDRDDVRMLLSVVHMFIFLNELAQRRRHDKLVRVRRVTARFQRVDVGRSQLEIFLNITQTHKDVVSFSYLNCITNIHYTTYKTRNVLQNFIYKFELFHYQQNNGCSDYRITNHNAMHFTHFWPQKYPPVNWLFLDTWMSFWPERISDTTNDSYIQKQEMNRSSTCLST